MRRSSEVDDEHQLNRPAIGKPLRRVGETLHPGLDRVSDTGEMVAEAFDVAHSRSCHDGLRKRITGEVVVQMVCRGHFEGLATSTTRTAAPPSSMAALAASRTRSTAPSSLAGVAPPHARGSSRSRRFSPPNPPSWHTSPNFVVCRQPYLPAEPASAIEIRQLVDAVLGRRRSHSWRDIRKEAVKRGLVDASQAEASRKMLHEAVQAQRLADIRKAHGHRQSDVAALMGVSQARVSKLKSPVPRSGPCSRTLRPWEGTQRSWQILATAAWS